MAHQKLRLMMDRPVTHANFMMRQAESTSVSHRQRQATPEAAGDMLSSWTMQYKVQRFLKVAVQSLLLLPREFLPELEYCSTSPSQRHDEILSHFSDLCAARSFGAYPSIRGPLIRRVYYGVIDKFERLWKQENEGSTGRRRIQVLARRMGVQGLRIHLQSGTTAFGLRI